MEAFQRLEYRSRVTERVLGMVHGHRRKVWAPVEQTLVLSPSQSCVVRDPRGVRSEGEGENRMAVCSVLVLVRIEVEQRDQPCLVERLV